MFKVPLNRVVGIVVGVAFMVAAQARGDEATEVALLKQLAEKGGGAAAAMNVVLKEPGIHSAAVLYYASAVALREKKMEDAGFLFSVAQLRADIDRHVFTPKGTGGDDPAVAFGALNEQIGSVLNPPLMREPKAFARDLERVKTWKAQFPAGYSPGYEYTSRLDDAAAEKIYADDLKSFLGVMMGPCTLLQDDAYFAAFKTVQDFNLKLGVDRPSQKAYDKAMETMRQIEKKKGIKGMATQAG
jgi:hypothetical protein